MFCIAFHFQRLRVTIGEPFMLPRSEGRLDRAQLQAATNEVMGHIAALLPPSYRGVYSESVSDGEEGECA